MKAAILAGGYGSRLAEETQIRPKPLVEIGGDPILLHIMKHFAHFDIKDFYIALGYKGEMIKSYFVDYHEFGTDMTVDFQAKKVTKKDDHDLDWKVNLIDTGIKTMTGGRVRRLRHHLSNGTFMLTYGDGVADVQLDKLLAFHRKHGKLATMTAVRPPARFGHLVFDDDKVVEFSEKPQIEAGWINGGFFVLEPGIFEYIDDDQSIWERDPLERIAADGQLMAFRHDSFWQCMDTLREKFILEDLWKSGKAPWDFSRKGS